MSSHRNEQLYLSANALILACFVFVLFVYLHRRIFKKKKNEAFVVWFTGLSGSGKSVLADMLYNYLSENNLSAERISEDDEQALIADNTLGKEEREKHMKGMGYVASYLQKKGINVIVPFISPSRDSRRFVRGLCKNFIEVYVKASLAVCEDRDPKGLYDKVRRGEIKNFPGVNEPYEEPENPEILIDTDYQDTEESFGIIKDYIKKYL